MRIGRKLKTLRTSRNMTLDELANALNKYVPANSDITYNKGKLSKWERDVDVPTLYALKYVADFFNVTVDDMIESKELEPEREIPDTIAAHFEDDKITDEDLKEINRFIEFIKNKK